MWLICVEVRQKTATFCKEILLQLKKKKKSLHLGVSASSGPTHCAHTLQCPTGHELSLLS